MYEYRAYIERCVDGDTVIAVIDLGFNVSFRGRFRLHGIDTPERGQPGFHEATAYLEKLLEYAKREDGWVWCETFKDKSGKYGRYLADFMDAEGCSICDVMIDSGHAKVYE